MPAARGAHCCTAIAAPSSKAVRSDRCLHRHLADRFFPTRGTRGCLLESVGTERCYDGRGEEELLFYKSASIPDRCVSGSEFN